MGDSPPFRESLTLMPSPGFEQRRFTAVPWQRRALDRANIHQVQDLGSEPLVPNALADVAGCPPGRPAGP